MKMAMKWCLVILAVVTVKGYQVVGRREWVRRAWEGTIGSGGMLWIGSKEVMASDNEGGEIERIQEEKGLQEFMIKFNQKNVPVTKFLGKKASIVVNVKFDDPITLQQMPQIVDLIVQYGTKGLHVLAVPTDQGYSEADDDDILKIKFYQTYGFGQYPVAVVTDKTDIVGKTASDFYKYLGSACRNPYGIGKITLNYEKFLLDGSGKPVRRYPRKYEPIDIEPDIQALLNDQPLPEETLKFKKAWYKAQTEATKSEYAFKKGLNYYS